MTVYVGRCLDCEKVTGGTCGKHTVGTYRFTPIRDATSQLLPGGHGPSHGMAERIEVLEKRVEMLHKEREADCATLTRLRERLDQLEPSITWAVRCIVLRSVEEIRVAAAAKAPSATASAARKSTSARRAKPSRTRKQSTAKRARKRGPAARR